MTTSLFTVSFEHPELNTPWKTLFRQSREDLSVFSPQRVDSGLLYRARRRTESSDSQDHGRENQAGQGGTRSPRCTRFLSQPSVLANVYPFKMTARKSWGDGSVDKLLPYKREDLRLNLKNPHKSWHGHK